MKFRNKILLSIWGVVVSLLIITFFFINTWMRARIEESSLRELHTSYATVSVHEQLQSAQLIRACNVIAESPRLRAVAELGDARTAFQLMAELYPSTLGQVMVLTDRQRRPLVKLLRGMREEDTIPRNRIIDSAAARIPSTDVWSLQGRIYRVVSVPILVGTELVGTLTLGFEITPQDIAVLKRATNSDVVLVNESATILSTLDSAEARALLPAIASLRGRSMLAGDDSAAAAVTLATENETYLGTRLLLNPMAADNSMKVFYLLLKPISLEVRHTMSSILGTFGLVSTVFLVLTTIVGLVISRSMTRSISELVRGTTEIDHGNYDYVIRSHGRDELALLARRFMGMSASLKEKISELGRLNQDLLDRNKDLDDTLRRLQSAQEDLIRSERLAATGRMTAQLAHEVNNPIHNIQSCLTTALNRLPQDIKGRDLIDVAYGEVNRLSRLAGQMLNFYRGTIVQDERKPVNLNDLLTDVIALTAGELTNAHIVLFTEIDPHLPLISGSRDKIQQVLLNLITNARDAMPGSGRLDILARAHDGTVRMTVKDNGTGIAQEHLPRIFDAFFTTKKKVSGVGLGLSVCYGIVSQHRGSIEVESSPGKGSAFTIVLPTES